MSERSTFWLSHLSAIEAEGITTKAYAEREGLSPQALYQWRKRLVAGGRRSRAKLGAGVRRAPCKVGAFPAGANPARPLSLRPVAIGAVMEVTKWLKPSV
jgi:hypothetical protein